MEIEIEMDSLVDATTSERDRSSEPKRIGGDAVCSNGTESEASWELSNEFADEEFLPPSSSPSQSNQQSGNPESTTAKSNTTRPWWLPFRPLFAANGSCVSSNLAEGHQQLSGTPDAVASNANAFFSATSRSSGRGKS